MTVKVGDHLKVKAGLYDHHAIYVGDGRVIHYAGNGKPAIGELQLRILEQKLRAWFGQAVALASPIGGNVVLVAEQARGHEDARLALIARETNFGLKESKSEIT